MTPPEDKTSSVISSPMLPIGKELRDRFEKVRDEPIPERLRQLISDLKYKEATHATDEGNKNEM